MEPLPRPFALIRNFTPKNPIQQLFSSSVVSMTEKLLLLPQLNALYNMTSRNSRGKSFTQTALDMLDVRFNVSLPDLDRIPESGPLVVVANHPFGLIEALGIHVILSKVRPDIKILANSILESIPETAEFCLYVDLFNQGGSAIKNSKSLKEAVRWLKNGGVVAIFPAGEVASVNIKQRRIVDPIWNSHVARLIRMSHADTLPIFFNGQNSPMFHIGGLMHPRVRTALLPRELLNKVGKEIRTTVGNTISYKKLSAIESDTALVDYLKTRTNFLRTRFNRTNTYNKFKLSGSAYLQPVRTAPCTELLQRELAELPQDQKLITNRNMEVYYAMPGQIPNILQEIGRLREITFREVGEGTGLEIDLDTFDNHYIHLFVWNAEKSELVGAYRLGQSDKIIAENGIDGLYTRTLFKIKPQLFTHLNPALELGRSFIRREYQKVGLSLPLLWRGISHFVVRNPQYRYLFGPVSISNDYHKESHKIMVNYLKKYHVAGDLNRWVKPNKPFKKFPAISNARIIDLDDVADYIADIESDGKGIPVLLREYLKLGGKLIDFNVDAKFNNCIDGLIVVDLIQTPEKNLRRYMGDTGYDTFKNFHLNSRVKGR